MCDEFKMFTCVLTECCSLDLTPISQLIYKLEVTSDALIGSIHYSKCPETIPILQHTEILCVNCTNFVE